MTIDLKVDDAVQVKKDVKCPDDETILIAGWQGRITEIFELREENRYNCAVQWDSITLEEVPESFIISSKEDGLDYSMMTLYIKDLEKAETRDSKEDVKRAFAEIEEKYSWVYFGIDEQWKRINRILKDVKDEGIMEVLRFWENYLEDNLDFPFEAEVFEPQRVGPIEYGDKLIVEKIEIEMVDDLYGIIIEVKKDREEYHFPLCDLKVIDEDSSNYKYIDDYTLWFGNR